ncbi:hypothetical protein Ddye_026160 [Dipteronia dyeriana]|uniref:Reverse transcriptase domain-containing protein n=1 Tax=Dipteronia dyeriana TaxID=168575 RepID=A0AAD9TMQ7_9ROSI|nr:hypothetical protein Ddye_026160 [Dipteronia dyeriana]
MKLTCCRGNRSANLPHLDHIFMKSEKVQRDQGPLRGGISVVLNISSNGISIDKLPLFSEMAPNLAREMESVGDVPGGVEVYVVGSVGVVMAEEIIHEWKKDKEEGLLLKLDFEKAYDSVDNVFLYYIIDGMGFGERWRNWVRDSISSPALSILVNGCPTQQFDIEKEIHQGDHLSHFLFNVVVESLSSLLRKAHGLDMIMGISFCNNDVHITHLQFAEDTIVFLKPKMEFLVNAERILRCFELASGLKINFHKSCIVRIGEKCVKWRGMCG